eukprot:3934647-Rhodomonas_salina.1
MAITIRGPLEEFRVWGLRLGRGFGPEFRAGPEVGVGLVVHVEELDRQLLRSRHTISGHATPIRWIHGRRFTLYRQLRSRHAVSSGHVTA